MREGSGDRGAAPPRLRPYTGPFADRPPFPDPPPDDTATRVLPVGAGGRHARPRLTRAELMAKIRRQLPFLVVAVVVAVAFWRIALDHWREGSTELGFAMLLASVMRAILDRTTAGLLAVRGRRTDIVTYALVGLVLMLVALTITGGPLTTR